MKEKFPIFVFIFLTTEKTFSQVLCNDLRVNLEKSSMDSKQKFNSHFFSCFSLLFNSTFFFPFSHPTFNPRKNQLKLFFWFSFNRLPILYPQTISLWKHKLLLQITFFHHTYFWITWVLEYKKLLFTINNFLHFSLSSPLCVFFPIHILHHRAHKEQKTNGE